MLIALYWLNKKSKLTTTDLAFPTKDIENHEKQISRLISAV